MNQLLKTPHLPHLVGIVFKASRVLLVLDPKERLRIQLEHGIKSALVVNLKLTLYHAIFTWLTFHAAGCELVYIPTFLAGLLSLIPLISPMYIFLPGSVSLFFRFSAPWGVIFAAAFCIAHLFVAFVVDSRIVESEMVLRVNKRKLAGIASSGDLFEPSTPVLAPSNSKADDTSAAEDSDTILMSYSRPNAIIIGLCFWLGYWNFGGIEGLVLAPILVSCVPILISHFYGKLVASSK